MCNENSIYLFLNQNICCGYSKEPSQGDGSFKHPKHMLKWIGKKIFPISDLITLSVFGIECLVCNLCPLKINRIHHWCSVGSRKSQPEGPLFQWETRLSLEW